jgi:hypothetical protein
MKFTQQELLQAVRTAAEGHESFTSADVRKQLGLETRDKRELSQFQHSFRNFRKTLGADLEKLSNNRYRLREGASEAALPVSVGDAPHASEIDVVAPSEACEQVGLSLAAAPSELRAELDGESAALPAAPSTHHVTQPPAGRGSWRERAQQLGRRMVRLVSNIGFGARNAA